MTESLLNSMVSDSQTTIQLAQLELVLASAERALARAEVLLLESYRIPMLRWPTSSLEVTVLDHYPEQQV